MGVAVAPDGRQQGWLSLLMLRRDSDHGCHEVTELLPSGTHRENGWLPWACLFTEFEVEWV